MVDQAILILNPGAMGSAVGSRLVGKGHVVYCVRDGRGEKTIARAEAAGMQACESLSEGLSRTSIVLSVCPPHAALDVARQVAQHEFSGRYVDANAVSPETSAQVGSLVEAAGAQFTDGGIIGPPPVNGRRARLYLSGAGASELAELLDAESLSAVALQGSGTAASALKMCFAGWNKARTALLLNLRALSAHHGVDEALLREWGAMEPELLRLFEPGSGQSVMGNAAKAWRWSGEMTEIAKTFEQAGLPGGFHHGAADVFERLDRFKDVSEVPGLEELTSQLRQRPAV
ncbi:MAG: DUF1932 domain-containing protein [Burkholderiaceae bacterium]